MNRKIIAAALALFLLCLSACSEQIPPETTGNTTLPTEATAPRQTEPAATAQTLPAETLPETTQPLPPPETEPVIPLLHNTIALRDYLRAQEDAGNRSFTFRYTGAPGDVTAQSIVRIGGYFYAEVYSDGELCQVQVTEYPGDRIVEAWRSGNTAALPEPEQQTLQIALTMVEQARERAHTQAELEQELFDLLRSHVTYNDGSTEIADPLAPPRHLTAVGALVDGSANCQGYADGFYTLASLAGFQIGRMHVDIPDGGHTVNVIQLDGAWYVVDATYNDLDDPSGVQISYAMLNVGRDKCLRYSWEEAVERYPITQHTDHHFYYYQPETSHARQFSDVNAIAQQIVDDWQVYDTREFYLLLEGRLADWSELGASLEQIAASAGRSITYSIWYEHIVQDTYFYVSLG